MKIYTKMGDQGETCLIGGKKVKKWHIKLNAYGSIDELNSHLGLVSNLIQSNPNLSDIQNQCNQQFFNIQNKLFNCGSLLACPDSEKRKNLPQIYEDDITALEAAIDLMQDDLAPLKNFILPKGGLEACHCHIARTVCRRVERLVIEAAEDDPDYKIVIKYLNRLSDYLFVLARFINRHLGLDDIEWKK
jgi:cob(I)alamin adenosyltransferase